MEKTIHSSDKIQVTAVIPAYNAAKFIEQTLESLSLQTQQFSEIIVIDDGSTDNTSQVVNSISRSLNSSISLFRFYNNKGVSFARNKGMELAKEKWVMFMDADDVAAPKLLESLCHGLTQFIDSKSKPRILAYPAYSQINGEGKSLLGVQRGKQVGPDEILGYLLVRNLLFSTSGVMVNKQKALDVGGFDTRLSYSEDWDFWIRLAIEGGFSYIDEPLVRIRRHPGNASKNITNMLEGEREVLDKYSLSFIKKAVFKRRLSWEENTSDLLSLLSRLDCWLAVRNKAKDLIKANSVFPEGHFYLGLYHLKMQEWKKAAECFSATLILSPSHGAALNNSGALKMIQGNQDGALLFFEEALTLFPNFMDAKHNLFLLSGTKRVVLSEVKFTWRGLRPVLTTYEG